jgi:retron-type reverse transcriptase
MGLFSWLRAKWRRLPSPLPPLVRDVSRLESTPDRLDAISEVIDQSGGPLVPGHLRRALRDPRLLPKRKRRDLLGRGIRYVEADEAKRLFGATLRTRDRSISDLLPDEEQLARYGLPLWRTEAELAAALRLSVKELRFFSIHRQASRVIHYTAFTIPKRSGGQRLILAPKRRLKRIQRALLPLLIDRLPVSQHAHGFRPGRSVRSNASLHVGRAVVLQLDLHDFFPTVTFGRVRGLLVALGYGYAVAAILATLLTEAPRQPVEVGGVLHHVPIGPRHCVQGAPTSPGLCNCVCRRLDHRLAGLARAFGFVYTRYADDLTFSADSAQKVHALRTCATRIIEEEGFRVNTDKTRVARRGSRQRVTGVTVNEVLGLSRRERRRLRAAIHQLGKQGADAERLAEVRGQLAYLAMLNPQQAEALRRRGGGIV